VDEQKVSNHTSNYKCRDCKFAFTDDDIYDRMPRMVKVRLHREQHGQPATIPVDEQMWNLIDALERGDELITDLATHTDTLYLMGRGHAPQVIPNAIVNELVEYGRLRFDKAEQAYYLVK
jgi:hypothetical protein